MGAAAKTASLIAAQIGGPLLAGLFAPDPQEAESFADDRSHPNIDPRVLLENANEMLKMLSGMTMARAGQPISLPSSYVQTPGAYTGGGMAMPIGVSAEDPALANPDLLTLPGLSFGDIFAPDQPPQDYVDPDEGYRDPDGSGNNGRIAVPRPPGRTAATSGPMRRGAGEGLRGADLLGEKSMLDTAMPSAAGDDDLDQAYGAVSLLMEALKSGDPQALAAFR